MAQPMGKRPRRATSARYTRKPTPRAQRAPKSPRKGGVGHRGGTTAYGFAVGEADVTGDVGETGEAGEAPNGATGRASPQRAFCLDCGEHYEIDAPGRHFGHLSLDVGGPETPSGVGGAGGAGSARVSVRSISIGEAATRAEPRWPTGWPGLDRLLGGGLVAHGVYLLSGMPGSGKCCAASTQVLDPSTGALVSLGTIVSRGGRDGQGAQTTVASVDPETLRLGIMPVVAVHANGKKPVWDLVTTLGRKIRATGQHPFLTPEGWRPLSDLAPGSRIAAPRSLPFFGTDTMPAPALRFLAYAIGDGSLADGQARITASVPEIVADLYESAEHLGCVLNTYRANNSTTFDFIDASRRRGSAGVGVNRATALLKEHGLHGKRSGEKRVPEAIFRQSREGLRVFLHALFSTDGSVYVSDNNSGHGEVSYGTTSEGLARDVHHLLLRFGFVARLRRKVSTYKNAPYLSFELALRGTPEVRRFLREIGLHGRDEAKAALASLAEPTMPSTRMDTIPTSPDFWEMCTAANRALRAKVGLQGGTGVCDGRSRGRPRGPIARETAKRLADALPNAPWLGALAYGDVWWDEVESITPAGEEDVYDLSVPPYANFVANDIIVHNSTLTMQLASQLRAHGAAVLVNSGEENEAQIGTRAARLNVDLDDPGLRILATNNLGEVRSEITALAGTEGDPDIVIIDSAQAMQLTTEPGGLGSVTQVRAVGHHAVSIAKKDGRCVIMIAHVTKDGDIAGPQTLVHAVDAWLHLNRDDADARWLKTPKNRFGPTSEVVALDMGPLGLRETRDPASLLLEDLAGEVGVAVGVAVVGDAAPVLVPVEAFVGDEEDGASVAPLGFTRERLRFLVEALARHANIDLRDRPLRVKVPTIGGSAITDGGLDLAVCAALLSAYYQVALPPCWAAWGEASLSGVVQRASRPEARVDALRAAVASGPLARAATHGGARDGAQAPARAVAGAWVPQRTPPSDGVELLPVRRLSDLALYVARLPGANALPPATVRVKVPTDPGAPAPRRGKGRGAAARAQDPFAATSAGEGTGEGGAGDDDVPPWE